MAAWILSLASSLEGMLRTSPLTASSLFESRAAISLVGIPLGNKTQHSDFGRGQLLVGRMFGGPEGDYRGKGFLAGMHDSNGGEKCLVQLSLSRYARAPALSAQIACTSLA
jgi:hypothetical protein